MKKFNMLVVLASLVLASSVNAQRYLKPMFDVNPSKTIAYGKNYTVLAVPSLGKTVPQPLAADVYTPKGDVETKRPLVIYFHTGSFLPTPQNGSPSGSRTDSTAVNICKRFAAMGYVAVSADYRLGWNPTATTQEARANTLINAAYRGVQDGRTAIRYFKENAATFGVDTLL
jgi:acetyl esterase/lipase